MGERLDSLDVADFKTHCRSFETATQTNYARNHRRIGIGCPQSHATTRAVERKVPFGIGRHHASDQT